jgi:hypothetical protein
MGGRLALEQTLHVVAITVFSYVDFKVASAYIFDLFQFILHIFFFVKII